MAKRQEDSVTTLLGLKTAKQGGGGGDQDQDTKGRILWSGISMFTGEECS
jgi:hypothetical protein